MNIQRAAVGVSGILLLMLGVVLLWANQGQDTSVSGILVRIGVMLVVVWVGYPSLIHADGQRSLIWFFALFGVLFLVAFRPRLFVPMIILTAAAMAINWFLKMASSELKGSK